MLYKDLLKTISVKNIKNAKYLLDFLLIDEEKSNKKKINIFKLIKFKIKLIKSKNEPLQYLVGYVNFYGYNYKVNKNVLIPRFETEELVENTIKKIKANFGGNISILDVGTGSGCIGITLKKELKDIKLTLSDISKKALRVAKYNANGEDIEIIHSNVLENIKDKYDVLISNPPYISHDEKIMDVVKKNEPKLALYAKNDGLYFYEEILKHCSKVLKDEYLIAFEIGEKQGLKVKELAKAYLGDVKIEIKKDLSKRNRMIFITNKG